MFRWLAYSGSPVNLEDLLYKPGSSLVVQSRLGDETRLIVSEPLGSRRGAWRELPESSCLVVHAGLEELAPFSPQIGRAVA